MRGWRVALSGLHSLRCSFTTSARRLELKDIRELPDRIHPSFQETRSHDLLGLTWPQPLRNILLVKKDLSSTVNEAIVAVAKHINSEYPETNIVLLREAADELHEQFHFPIYTHSNDAPKEDIQQKIDLVSTLGGDGTILHASSLFSSANTVPPLLSFSMGTLGFLGEWKFAEYKQAFREVYMSGADQSMKDRLSSDDLASDKKSTPAGWSTIRGKFMGSSRNARVLLRSRLKVGIFDPDGNRVSSNNSQKSEQQDIYAMNEVIIHRGADPHLAIVEITVGGRHLTEAVADGMIISTPTGSTAYSLSSGGSIVHPLVPSLLLTPVCPRSLSFRPLVLPGNTPVTLRLSEKNRGREVDVSIDGVRRSAGLSVGMELRVCGEDVRDLQGEWVGGVPSIVRGHTGSSTGAEESWVGGLNSLLKFNYPLGEGV